MTATGECVGEGVQGAGRPWEANVEGVRMASWGRKRPPWVGAGGVWEMGVETGEEERAR